MKNEEINIFEAALGILDLDLPILLRAKFKCEICGKSALSEAEHLLTLRDWVSKVGHDRSHVRAKTSWSATRAVICPVCKNAIYNYWETYKPFVSDADDKAAANGDQKAKARVLKGLRRLVSADLKKRRKQLQKVKPALQHALRDKGFVAGIIAAVRERHRGASV